MTKRAKLPARRGDALVLREKGAPGLEQTQIATFRSISLKRRGSVSYIDTTKPSELGQIKKINSWIECFPLTAQSQKRLTHESGLPLFGLNMQWSDSIMDEPTYYTLQHGRKGIGVVFEFSNGEFAKFEGDPDGLFTFGWSSAVPLSITLGQFQNMKPGPVSALVRTGEESIKEIEIRDPEESIVESIATINDVKSFRADGDDLSFNWISIRSLASVGGAVIPLNEVSVFVPGGKLERLTKIIDETSTPGIERNWKSICQKVHDSKV